jgi:hypothetical protein
MCLQGWYVLKRKQLFNKRTKIAGFEAKNNLNELTDYYTWKECVVSTKV